MKDLKKQSMLCVNDIPAKPCSNAKFMNIASMEGMDVKTHYDGAHYEETTSVYRNGVLMAERIQGVIHFPKSKADCECWIVGYYKGIENETN